MKSIALDHELFLPGVSPDQAWEWLGDTEALNRLAGLPRVEVEVLRAPLGDTRSRIRTRGFFPPLTWTEGPFEFVRPRYHVVEREFSRGPVLRFRGGVEQAPEGDGTRVRFFAELTPRYRLLARLVRFEGRRRMRITAARIERAVRAHRETGAPVYGSPPTPLAAGATALLERAPEIAAFLRDAPDPDVLRIRPFELADRRSEPRLDVLRTLLQAARNGVVDLRWDVLCPHCRVPTVRGRALAELEADTHCDVCDFTYAPDLDSTVEVTFSVHPSVRPVEPVVFCLGAPARRHGVRFQVVVPPAETRTVEVDLRAGDYALTRADHPAARMVRVAQGGDTVRARLEAAGFGDERVEVAPGRIVFELENALDGPARVNLARTALRDDVASAAVVTALQDFRDLFSSEVLAPGVRMSVASVTLLFTDLKGSTAMYERDGDAPAYARVRDHFQLLTEVARAEGGSVVKTLGDAVMAAFPTAVQGFRAARAMREALQRTDLVVKLGLHAGPCIAVNANERLDYFGTTVNLAARLPELSDGNDLVLTEEVARDAPVAKLLQDRETESFEASVKGLRAARTLFRVR